MIVGSLLLIAFAALLLGAGVWQPSSALLSGSIAASLLAAVTLVAGARRAVADPVEPDFSEGWSGTPVPDPHRLAIPDSSAQCGPAQLSVDLPDEPEPQRVSAADSNRVGRMTTEVLVVPGRPRYHLSSCVHLLGRDRAVLPVKDAVALGFSPCGLCEPASALLAAAQRG